MIKNSTEEMFELLLQRALRDNPEAFKCTCDTCLDDIRARALNNLRPMYYSNLTGQLFTSFHHSKPQSQAEIQMELNSSIIKIGNHPSHECPNCNK